MASLFGTALLGGSASGASAAAALLAGKKPGLVVNVLPVGAEGTHLRGRVVAVVDGSNTTVVCAMKKKGDYSGESEEERAAAEVKLLAVLRIMASKTLSLLEEIASKSLPQAETSTLEDLQHRLRALLGDTESSAISADEALLRLLDLQGQIRLFVHSGSNYALPPLVITAPEDKAKDDSLAVLDKKDSLAVLPPCDKEPLDTKLDVPPPGNKEPLVVPDKDNVETPEETEYRYTLTAGEWEEMSGIARAIYSTQITLLTAAAQILLKK